MGLQPSQFQKERAPRIEFSQVRSAFNIFSRDYELVKHPSTPVRTPFERPNEGRQYSLTQIPKEMTETEFLNHLNGRLVISCIDKDAVGPLYNQEKDVIKYDQIVLLSFAGGIIQRSLKRKNAMSTILGYISQHQEKISGVLATGHDHTCGYVASLHEGVPLATKLRVKVAEEGENSSNVEQEAMKEMIAKDADEFMLSKLFESKVKVALAKIDRQGGLELDFIQ